jgi:gp16 family phage-associated protein
MKSREIRRTQDVRAEWLRKGISEAAWARENGFSPATVNQVLNGRNRATRGTGHKIAVLLGIKDGEIVGE